MAEQQPTPAAQQTGASVAATSTSPTPAQEDLQKIRDGVFAEARKKYEPLIAERDTAIKELEAKFSKEREWRLGVLEHRAKSLTIPESALKLARQAGPEAYEQLIGEFEALKKPEPSKPTPPVQQPGGVVGGSESLSFDVKELLPMFNGGRTQPLLDAYAKHGKAKVDAAIAAAKF